MWVHNIIVDQSCLDRLYSQLTDICEHATQAHVRMYAVNIKSGNAEFSDM